MIVAFIVFIVLLVLAEKYPKVYITLFVLYTSSFLGFYPKVILLSGYDFVPFTFSAVNISVFLYKSISYKISRYNIYLFLLLLIYTYGVMAPYLIGMGTIIPSIIESKEFANIFLLHYLSSKWKNIDNDYLINLIIALSVYYLFILNLFSFTGITPLFYVKYENQLQYYFPSIVTIALLIIAFRFNYNLLVIVGIVIIWFNGMLVEMHMAITYGFIILLIMMLLRVHEIPSYINKVILFLLVLFVFFFTALYLYIDISSITDSVSNLYTRDYYNYERIKLLMERPLFGYGFLHHSDYMIDDTSVYTTGLSFIDSGYIDLLGKFGIIGSLFYLYVISRLAYNGISEKSFHVYFYYLLIMFAFVNYTWALYTFSVGLIAISIIIHLINRNKK